MLSRRAQLRAAVPHGFALPPVPPSAGYLCHRIGANHPDFNPVDGELTHAETPPRHGDFLRYDEAITWRGGQAWAPPRPDLLLRLEGRDWVRVRFNGRTNSGQHDESSLWIYQDVTVNIGRFDDPPPRDLFIATEPAKVYDLRRELW